MKNIYRLVPYIGILILAFTIYQNNEQVKLAKQLVKTVQSTWKEKDSLVYTLSTTSVKTSLRLKRGYLEYYNITVSDSLNSIIDSLITKDIDSLLLRLTNKRDGKD